MTDDMDLKRTLKVCKLIDVYGSLLKENQLNLLKMYYFDNLSLSELSVIFNVSRQALNESINSSVNKLENYEQKLNKIKISEIIEQMTEENFEKSKQSLKDLI